MRKIRLFNFQAHSNLEVSLGTLTCITGPSDTGKSAVIRALRWVCLNDLRGSDFVKWGAKECAVEVEMEGGTVVRRSRKGGENYYHLTVPGSPEKEFKAFGNSVPQEIAEVLGVSSINFQSQHDGPFWFSLSDGEVGRRLNEIVDLTLIDKSQTKVAVSIRSCTAALAIRQEDLVKAIEECGRYKHVEQISAELENLEYLDSHCVEVRRKVTALGVDLSEIEERKKACVEVPSFSRVESAFAFAKQAGEKITKLERDIAATKALYKQALEASDEHSTIAAQFTKATETLICPTCQKKVFWLS